MLAIGKFRVLQGLTGMFCTADMSDGKPGTAAFQDHCTGRGVNAPCAVWDVQQAKALFKHPRALGCNPLWSGCTGIG